MSTSRPTEARLPQRERGQIRVTAIMEAAAAIFREKGFDAATMSDVAAKSGTAFGSLYRFFPSKESLADALLQQFAHNVIDRLNTLAVRAPALSPREVSTALVDFMIELQAEKSFAVSVLEARGDSSDKRTQFRTAVRDRIAVILRNTLPHLTTIQVKSLSVLTLHVLKGVTAATHESPALRRLLVGHYKDMLISFLTSLGNQAPVEEPIRRF